MMCWTRSSPSSRAKTRLNYPKTKKAPNDRGLRDTTCAMTGSLHHAAHTAHPPVHATWHWRHWLVFGYFSNHCFGRDHKTGNRSCILERGPSDLDVIHAGLAACNTYNTGMVHADAVQCPTLFILGNRDIMTPARAGKELAKVITGARVELLEGTGHSLMMERPNDVLDALITVV